MPEICVVDVSSEFLEENPQVAFSYHDGTTSQPQPGPSLGSRWIDSTEPTTCQRITLTSRNLDALAALFVADNLLCMNDDHAQGGERDFGNLLIDAESNVWVIDWGHPFRLRNGVNNNWSSAVLSGHLDWLRPVAKGLLEIAEVRTRVVGKAEEASRIPADEIESAFAGIPGEWQYPNEGGVSGDDCKSARDFLLQRRLRLPKLIEKVF